MNIRVAILTVSDRSFRGEREDASGPALAGAIKELSWQVISQEILPDEQDQIAEWLRQVCDTGMVDIILTTGGTGFAPRDVTPEATLAVCDRLAPGLAEAMRAESLKITTHAMLSRAQAGIRKNTLIINLPGSPRAAVENFTIIKPVLGHAVELLIENPASEMHHSSGDTKSNR